MKRSTKWILLSIAVLIIAILFIRMRAATGSTPKVASEKAARRTISETVTTNGKIYPREEVRVSPDFSGQVTELKVAEGDSVKKGQVLARINNSEAIESPIDGVVLAVKVKKGESVTGNNFSQGTEMFIVADMRTLEVRVDIGENDIIKIETGDIADITIEAYGSRKFKGSVMRIANTVKTATGMMPSANDITSYEVRILLDSSSYSDLSKKQFAFRPGMNASAAINTTKKENVLAVPIGAVTARLPNTGLTREDAEKEKLDRQQDETNNTAEVMELEEVVFVLQPDQVVKKVAVVTGIQDIGYIEIVSGLKEGDEVITAPFVTLSKTLKEGTKVKVVPRDKLFEN